jgi:hypothetical protein
MLAVTTASTASEVVKLDKKSDEKSGLQGPAPAPASTALPGDAVVITADARLYRATTPGGDDALSATDLVRHCAKRFADTTTISKEDLKQVLTTDMKIGRKEAEQYLAEAGGDGPINFSEFARDTFVTRLQVEMSIPPSEENPQPSWENLPFECVDTKAPVPLVPRECTLSPVEQYMAICGQLAEPSHKDRWRATCVVVEVGDHRGDKRRAWAIPAGGDRIIRHAEWHPLSAHHLVVLSDDNELLMYDLTKSRSVPEQIFALHASADDHLVNFRFAGRGGAAATSGWERLTVYALSQSGAIYTACPVVPFGVSVEPSVLVAAFQQTALAFQMSKKSHESDVSWQFNQTCTWLEAITGDHFGRLVSLAKKKDAASLLKQSQEHWVKTQQPKKDHAYRVKLQRVADKPDSVERWCDLAWLSAGALGVAVRVSAIGKVHVLLHVGTVEPHWVDGTVDKKSKELVKAKVNPPLTVFEKHDLAAGEGYEKVYEELHVSLLVPVGAPEHWQQLEKCRIETRQTRYKLTLDGVPNDLHHTIDLGNVDDLDKVYARQKLPKKAQHNNLFALCFTSNRTEYVLGVPDKSSRDKLADEIAKGKGSFAGLQSPFPSFRVAASWRLRGLALSGDQKCFGLSLPWLTDLEGLSVDGTAPGAIRPSRLQQFECGGTIDGCVLASNHKQLNALRATTTTAGPRTDNPSVWFFPQGKDPKHAFPGRFEVEADVKRLDAVAEASGHAVSEDEEDNEPEVIEPEKIQASLSAKFDLTVTPANAAASQPVPEEPLQSLALWIDKTVGGAVPPKSDTDDQTASKVLEECRKLEEFLKDLNADTKREKERVSDSQKSRYEKGISETGTEMQKLTDMLAENAKKAERCMQKMWNLASGPPLAEQQKFDARVVDVRKQHEIMDAGLRRMQRSEEHFQGLADSSQTRRAQDETSISVLRETPARNQSSSAGPPDTGTKRTPLRLRGKAKAGASSTARRPGSSAMDSPATPGRQTPDASPIQPNSVQSAAFISTPLDQSSFLSTPGQTPSNDAFRTTPRRIGRSGMYGRRTTGTPAFNATPEDPTRRKPSKAGRAWGATSMAATPAERSTRPVNQTEAHSLSAEDEEELSRLRSRLATGEQHAALANQKRLLAKVTVDLEQLRDRQTVR